MDRKEKIALASLTVATVGQMITIFLNWEKLAISTTFREFFVASIPIPIWILILFVFGSVILIWSNIPKKKKLKIEDIHILIMKTIANNDLPKSNQILDVLLKNNIEISKTRLEFYLFRLLDNDYIEIGYHGNYYLVDKGRSYLVKKGYE